MGSPRLMLFRRRVRSTRGAAHAMALIFRLRGNASHQIGWSRQKGDEQQNGLNARQHGLRVDGSRDLDGGRAVFIPGWRRFLSTEVEQTWLLAGPDSNMELCSTSVNR